MSKTLGFIIAAIQIGVGIATGNVALIVSGTLQLAGLTITELTTPGATKPDTTEQSIKTERPPRVKAYGTSRLYGASVLFTTTAGTSIDVWAYADGRANSILRTYLNDDQVTVSGGVVAAGADKRYQNGRVRLGYNLGLPTETVFSSVTALLPAWDASHRGDGVVTGYVLKAPEKDKYFLETYPQGDAISMSLVGEWQLTYDPRDPAQDPYDQQSWTFSENAVRAFIHYLMVERGFDWDTRFAPQLAKIADAINDADVAMALAVGGTEPRYRTALSYKAFEQPANVISSLLSCFDGWYCINESGEVVIYSGRYYTPTVTIGPDQIVSYRHQSGVEDENVVNEIAVPYVSSLHDYNTVDGQPWQDEGDISTRGRLNTGELSAVVPSHTQGRRLAKRKMIRNNANDRGTVTTTFAGRAVMGERYINLVLDEAGAVFFDGVAEITAVERDPSTGGVTFEWVAADPNVDAWNPSTEDGVGAPVGAPVAVDPIATPTITSTSVSYDATLGARRVLIIGGGPDRIDLTWFVRWRTSSSETWVEEEYADTDTGAGVMLLTNTVPQVAALQVAIACRTSDGRVSAWSATSTLNTA